MSRLAALMTAVLLTLGAPVALAHRVADRVGPAPQGVSIPSLTHGQMAVISDNLRAIRALAATRGGYDMTTWRLEDYLNLQSFACFWGLVPGSVADEGSPFNECAHAYLAAGRSLLLQLGQTPGVDHKAVAALTAKIETEMIANGAALTICRYSDEPFNSNEIVWPHWEMVPRHPPTLALIGSLLAAAAASVRALWPRRAKAAAS